LFPGGGSSFSVWRTTGRPTTKRGIISENEGRISTKNKRRGKGGEKMILSLGGGGKELKKR